MELTADAVAKDGMEYHQRYAWVMRFDETGVIVQVSAAGGLREGCVCVVADDWCGR